MKILFLTSFWLLPMWVYAHVSCTYCHVNDNPTSSNAMLNKSVPDLCITCHPDRVGKNEHIIGVAPRSSLNQPLPLANGLITCTTCHDPHSQQPTLLRINKEELCGICPMKPHKLAYMQYVVRHPCCKDIPSPDRSPWRLIFNIPIW